MSYCNPVQIPCARPAEIIDVGRSDKEHMGKFKVPEYAGRTLKFFISPPPPADVTVY